jgi:hypothetical protein
MGAMPLGVYEDLPVEERDQGPSPRLSFVRRLSGRFAAGIQ